MPRSHCRSEHPDRTRYLLDYTRIVHDQTRLLQDPARHLPDPTRPLPDHTRPLPDHTRLLPDRLDIKSWVFFTVFKHGILLSCSDRAGLYMFGYGS